jgi:archaellum biogenesis ATPase FlaH
VPKIGKRRVPAPAADPYQHVPAELRELPRWCVSAPGSKMPLNPRTGANAKCNDPTTWGRFDEALAAMPPGGTPHFALAGDGIAGMDLDRCRDPATGAIEPWAQAIIRRFATYTEISSSGAGLRLFVRGTLPPHGRKRGQIEVYGNAKFLSVTGRQIFTHGAGAVIADRSGELLAWHREVFGDGAAPTSTKENNGRLVPDPATMIDPARLSRLPAKAQAIVRGEHDFPSQSEADMSLANSAARAGWTDQEIAAGIDLARIAAGEPIKPLARALTVRKARADALGSLRERVSRTQRAGTDPVRVGAEPTADVHTGDMGTVMKLVAGVRYLMRDWLPFGMLTMLLGEPGSGKSAFALYAFVRTVLLGCNWFNGMRGPGEPGCALWCDTEGAAAITVQRVNDWALPADQIKVPFDDDPLRSVNLTDPAHLARIDAVVTAYKIKLVVIDSLRGAHVEDENNSRVAAVLQALAGIAERTGAAILIIHHARKLGADEAVSANSSRGSNALLAMVRSQLGIDRPDKSSDWRRLLMLKENLGLKPRPVGFRISSAGLDFGPPPTAPQKESVKDKAAKFLRDRMTAGKPYAAAELIAEAAKHGIGEVALHRAKSALGIVVVRVKAGWQWTLPG